MTAIGPALQPAPPAPRRPAESAGAPSPQLVERVLSRALALGGDFAELFWEERWMQSMSGDDRKIDRVQTGAETGTGIRVDDQDRTLFAFTESTDEDGLLAAATAVSRLVRGTDRSVSVRVTPRTLERPNMVTIPFDALQTGGKTTLIVKGHEVALGEDPRIRHSTAYLSAIEQRVAIANTDSLYATDRRVRVRFRVKAFARDSDTGKRSMGVAGTAAACGFEQFDKEPVEKVARKAARQALTLLEAGTAPAGPMPVVLASGTGGILVHEAIGHNLEADAVHKGASVFSGMLGQRIGSDRLTVVDDATLPRGLGSLGMDDEGMPAGRTVLIDHGVLVSVLSDRTAARRTRSLRTGNGRRSSFRQLALCRMTNTFLLSADMTSDEVIAGTGNGLYVVALSGGSVNPVNGSFVFTAREAYRVRDGRVCEPVRGASLAGKASEVLQDVVAVGDDLDIWGGNCARSGQRVWTGFGMPTVRIRELTVGGDAAGE